MDDISPSPTVGPALSRPGANKKKKNKLEQTNENPTIQLLLVFNFKHAEKIKVWPVLEPQTIECKGDHVNSRPSGTNEPRSF